MARLKVTEEKKVMEKEKGFVKGEIQFMNTGLC